MIREEADVTDPAPPRTPLPVVQSGLSRGSKTPDSCAIKMYSVTMTTSELTGFKSVIE